MEIYQFVRRLQFVNHLRLVAPTAERVLGVAAVVLVVVLLLVLETARTRRRTRTRCAIPA